MDPASPTTAVYLLLLGLGFKEIVLPGVRSLFGKSAARVEAAADATPVLVARLDVMQATLSKMEQRLEVVPAHDRRLAVLEDWRKTTTDELKAQDQRLHKMAGKVNVLDFARALERKGRAGEDDSAG